MNDCFFSDSDAAMPRQTQADNDASGSPQRVAGRPPLLFVLETVLHLPMVGTWRSERLWDGPYGCAMPRQIQADNDASGSPQRVAGRPPLLFVLETVLHLPMVGTWRSARLWDGPYGCAMPRQTQADNDASGSPQRVAGQPLRNRSQAMGTVCRWQAARFYRTQEDTAIGRMRRGRPNGRPA